LFGLEFFKLLLPLIGLGVVTLVRFGLMPGLIQFHDPLSGLGGAIESEYLFGRLRPSKKSLQAFATGRPPASMIAGSGFVLAGKSTFVFGSSEWSINLLCFNA
jgi:hypothetical protein